MAVINRSGSLLVFGVFVLAFAIAAYLKTIISISQTMQTHLKKIRIENDQTMKESEAFWAQSSVFNLFSSKPSKGRHIFLIGDSLDRYMLYDYCRRNDDLENSKHAENSGVNKWLTFPQDINDNSSGSPYVSHEKWYREEWDSGSRCLDKTTGDSVSSLHVFGSANSGPYYYGFKNIGNFKYIDTKPRIQYALNVYISRFGIPDIIVLHTTQWDKKFYYQSNNLVISNSTGPQADLWNQRLQEYESNLNLRIDQVSRILKQASHSILTYGASKSYQIILRTAVWNYETGEQNFLDAMNNITRRIAQERKLYLFDYDEDVWTVFHHDRNSHDVFRDAIHPNPRLSVFAEDKLLGRRYTSSINSNLHNMSVHKSQDSAALQHHLREQYVNLLQSESNLYFIQRLSPSIVGRWFLNQNMIEVVMNKFQLGPNDILHWMNDSAVQTVTADQGQLPDQLLARHPYTLAQLQVSESITFAMIFDGYYFTMNASLWDAWHRITPKYAILEQPLGAYWSQCRSSIFVNGGNLPPIYRDGSIVSCIYDKTVYQIQNMSRSVIIVDEKRSDIIRVAICKHLLHLPLGHS
jgi:hypothetical protein